MDTKVIFKKGVILLVIASFLLWNLTAIAAPEGGSVAQGSATISQSGAQTTINQSSQNAVINWNSFNTASHEAVQFNQPNASSVALNRITSGLPTTFAGQLTANGQVWILNPAGVLFTSTSKVDVAGLVASTLNIKDSDFMTKNYKLEQAPGALQGSVINNGSITSHENGLVALVAPTVENNGSIVTNMGNVLLASGTVATLDPYGDNLINFAPNNYAVEGSVKNTGSIKTNGGKVVMAANSVNNIVKEVVNNGGIIEARNIAQGADGVIILGGNSGTTNIGGKITSNKIIIKGHDTKIKGELRTEQPGMIETSGETISIDSSAVIDAGKGGLWYMDPLNINLSDYGSIIQQQLSSGTNVTIATGTNPSIPGAGVINADVPLSWDTTATLMLAAYGNINVTQPINIYGTGINGNGSGMLILRPNVTGTNPSVVNFSGAGSINTNTYGQLRLFYDPPSGYASPINYTPYLFGNPNYTANRPYMMIQNQAQFNGLMALAAAATPYTGVLLSNYNLNTSVSYFGSGPMFYTYGGVFDGHNYVTGANSTIYGGTISTPWANLMGTFAGAMNGATLLNTNFNVVTVDNSASLADEIGGVVGDMLSSSMSFVTFAGNIIDSGGVLVGGIVGGMQNSTLNGVQYVSGNMTSQLTVAAGGIVGADYDVNVVNGAFIGSSVTFLNVLVGSFGYIIGAVQGPNYTVISNSIVINPTTGIIFPSASNGGFVGVLRLGSTLYLQNSYVEFGGLVMSPAGNFDAALGQNENGGTNNVDTFGNTNYFTIGTSCAPSTCSDNLFPFVQYLGYNPFSPITPVYPSLPTANLGAGVLSSASSQSVSIYADNTLIASPTSNGSGLFTFYYDPNLNPSFFTASTSGTVTGITIKKFAPQSYSPLAGMNVNNNALTVVSDLVNPVSNADLASLSYPAFYSVSGDDLTLASGISFFTTSGTAYSLDGNINAPSGSVTFGGPVTVDANSTVTSGTGNIAFNNTIGGSADLTLSAPGTVTLGGAVSGINALDITGATMINTSSISTVGSQTYHSPVTLGANTLLSSSLGNVDFVSLVDGAYNLTVNASAGYVTFGGNVGSITPLTGLFVTAGGPITALGEVHVTGASSFNAGANAIDLSNPNNTFGGPVTLSNSGANDVTISSMGALTLAPFNIGGNLIAATSGGNIILAGINTSGGSQTYNSPVVLGAATTLNSGGVIDFNDTLNGAFALTTTAVTTSFDGVVGGITPLASLTVNGGVTQSARISVAGASTFNAGANAIDLSNSNNTFGGPIAINNSGNNPVTLHNMVATILAASSIGGDFTLTSGGPISQTGPLSVGGASSFDAGANAINLSNPGNSLVGMISLSNSGAGNNVTLVNSIPTALAAGINVGGALTVSSNGNNITLNGDVTSGGSQTYNDTVALGANATLTATSGNINFIDEVLGAGYDLTTSTVSPYSTVFDGVVSGVNILAVMGAADINTSSISTSGNQLYQGVVNLGANTDLSSTAANIHFFDNIAGNGYNLNTNTVSPYSTIFDGNVSNVNNLSVMGAATFPNATVITASGIVSFNNALNGAGSVNITAANTLITGNVGGVPPLSAFTVNGPVEFDGGVINADTQTYNGLVTVLSSVNPTVMNASGLIHFMNNLEGPGSLTLVAGSLLFDGNVGAITPLDVLDITAPVTFSGAGIFNASVQNYRGPVTIAGAGATITATTFVGFFDTVDGPGSLTVNAPVTQFTGIVGGTTPLNILTILNDVILDGVAIYANQQIFQGPATIGPGGALLVSPDVQFLSTIMGPGALNIIGNLTASDDINIGFLSVTGTTLYNKGSDQNVTTVTGQHYGDTVTLNNNLNIVNTGFGQIIFGGGGVYGPAYDLSVFNYSGAHVDGIVGSVNVNKLTLGGTGGANLVNSFIGSGGYSVNFLSMGYFCLNGSCEEVNLSIAQKLTLVYMPGLGSVICDVDGCRDGSYEMNVPNLLKASDPLGDICVIGADGKVACLNSEQ